MENQPSPDRSDALAAWREALADIAFTSAFATGDGAAEHVLALAELLAAHPLQDMAIDHEALRRMTDCGGHSAAALALVESLAGYMLSGAPGGRSMATVVLAGQADEHHAEGANAALALVGALATALAGPTAGTGASALQGQPGAAHHLN